MSELDNLIEKKSQNWTETLKLHYTNLCSTKPLIWAELKSDSKIEQGPLNSSRYKLKVKV